MTEHKTGRYGVTMNNNLELRDAVMTYIQVTGADITEDTKEIADMTDVDVIGCKLFHEMFVVGDQTSEETRHILPAAELINCGRRDVQAQYRVNLQRICKAEDIKVGDPVEVWIKKVANNENGGKKDERI